MKAHIRPEHRRFERQYGIITRAQALAAGMTSDQVTRAVAAGTWERLHPGVYRLSGSPPGAHATLLAACLATGGRASHESAPGCGACWTTRHRDRR